MLGKLFKALEKTRSSLLGAFKNIKPGNISSKDLENIEEQLLLADVGLDTVDNIIGIFEKFFR
jgi:Signal recognition particle GTPase